MRHAVVLLVLFVSVAHAEAWLPMVSLDDKGSTLSIDFDSVDRSGDAGKARFKFAFASDRPIAGAYRDVPPGVTSFRWELNESQFNCKDRTVAVASSILHDDHDKAVGHVEFDAAALNFRAVPPQSIGGRMVAAVCDAPRLSPDAGLARLTRPGNPDDFYPAESRRRGEQGAPILMVCVGPDGKLLREPQIALSSGFPSLDAAAIRTAAASHYAPALKEGVPMPESCVKFKVRFGRP